MFKWNGHILLLVKLLDEIIQAMVRKNLVFRYFNIMQKSIATDACFHMFRSSYFSFLVFGHFWL